MQAVLIEQGAGQDVVDVLALVRFILGLPVDDQKDVLAHVAH